MQSSLRTGERSQAPTVERETLDNAGKAKEDCAAIVANKQQS
jgi:hypothetical protein